MPTSGLSARALMATLIWKRGTIGDWFTATNWTPELQPAFGDTVIVQSGSPTVSASDQSVVGVQIILGTNALPVALGGSNNGSTVTLQAESATFEPLVVAGKIVNDLSLTVSGGDPGAPVIATLLSQGITTFAGQLVVEAIAGTLTIVAGSPGGTLDNFAFTNSANHTFVLVAQDSALHFEGEQITTAGVIQIEGITDIAAGVSFGGRGVVVLDDGGQLSIEGTVRADQRIDFADGTGKVTIANVPDFHGIFGFTNLGGARIDLTGVQAQSLTVQNGVLTLSTASGPVSFGVQLFNPETLEPTGQPLNTDDFTLAGDGNGGALVTYTPQGPTFLQASLPVPVVATAGTLVSLSTIFMQSFGTTTPSPYGITLLTPTAPKNTPTDQKYWVNPDIPPATSIAPAWYVNGVLQSGPYTVQPGDNVQLLVGNNIIDPAQVQVQVTPTATGTSAEFVTYNIWPVDPHVAALVKNAGAQAGHPTPADIIASAESWNTIFGNLPNTNLCNWIADNVAAGAGVPMPFPNALPDPSSNVSGGFWRIVYTGAGPSPVQDWYTLVQPGDIVRMEWFSSDPQHPLDHVGVHTTTVLSAVNADGTITVYDNIDHDIINGVETETIGIHQALYWPNTDPASITIYRLDPNQQYLIQGTSLAEVIQGSVFNDLIKPGGGADIITGGPGNNEIQGTIKQLNSITVTDFHLNDTLDFADLGPGRASVTYSTGTLQVFSDGVQVAAVTLPNPPPGYFFAVTPDGDGGSIVGLVPELVTIQNDHLGITRTLLPTDQATAIVNSIIAGAQTEAKYVSSLLAQVQNTALPSVAVEGSMYDAVGTSAEITLLTTQFLPPHVELAIRNGFDPQVYASEVLGLAFAFGNEVGSTAFAGAFGPSNAAMPNSIVGDAAFAAAAATAIFGSASTQNIINVIENWVANWKSFYASNGIPGILNASSEQIDLAARGTAWGDAVGTALASHLGQLNGQATNFLESAAQGMAIYSAALISQPIHAPFQGSNDSFSIAADTASDVQLLGIQPNLDHAMI